MFKYTGRILSDTDNDWAQAMVNLSKASKKRACMLFIVGHEGTDEKTLGKNFRVVFQAILLFI